MKSSEKAANSVRLEAFERYEPLIFSIGYDIVGSREEAGDLVHTVRENCLWPDDVGVTTDPASLVIMIASLALERLGPPEHQGEREISTGAAEPQNSSFSRQSAVRIRVASKFVLQILDELTPTERSAFLLQAVFNRDYSEISQIIGKDEVECRRIVHEARRLIASRSGTAPRKPMSKGG